MTQDSAPEHQQERFDPQEYGSEEAMQDALLCRCVELTAARKPIRVTWDGQVGVLDYD